MTKKTIIRLVIVCALIFLVLAEVYFLFVTRHQAVITQDLTAITPPSSSTGIGGTENAFDLPLGFFLIPQERSAQNLPVAYTLLAKLLDVSLQKDQSILAHIEFAQDQGRGKIIQQAISISPFLVFTTQNATTFFPSDQHKKTTLLRDPQQTLATLTQWKGHAILLTFNTKDPNPQPTPNTDLNTPECNNLLLLALSSKYNPPTCLPFTQQITVYAKF